MKNDKRKIIKENVFRKYSKDNALETGIIMKDTFEEYKKLP